MNLIKFVEQNVDGCGTDVDVLIGINMEIKSDDYQKFMDTIEELKTELTPDEWDTDTVVEMVMGRVFGEDADWFFVNPQMVIEFSAKREPRKSVTEIWMENEEFSDKCMLDTLNRLAQEKGV